MGGEGVGEGEVGRSIVVKRGVWGGGILLGGLGNGLIVSGEGGGWRGGGGGWLRGL